MPAKGFFQSLTSPHPKSLTDAMTLHPPSSMFGVLELEVCWDSDLKIQAGLESHFPHWHLRKIGRYWQLAIAWWLTPLNHYDKIPKFRRTSPIFHGLGVKFTGIQKILMSFLIFLIISPDFEEISTSRWRKRWSLCIPACWLRTVRGSWPTSSAPTWAQVAPLRCLWGRRIRSCFCGRCMPSPRAHGPSFRRSEMGGWCGWSVNITWMISGWSVNIYI